MKKKQARKSQGKKKSSSGTAKSVSGGAKPGQKVAEDAGTAENHSPSKRKVKPVAGQSPLISVITVVRNDPEGLSRTLDSYEQQIRVGCELLVFDGASTDETMEVARKRKTLIDVLHSGKDDGIFDAMNRAVKRASGQWIIFMNAGDCFADDDVLSRVRVALSSDTDILYGDVCLSFDVGTFLRKAGHPDDLWKGMICSHQSAIVKRALLLEFPFDLRFPLSADYRFFVQSSVNGARFGYLGFPVCIFEVGGLSEQKQDAAFVETMQTRRELGLINPWRWIYLYSFRGYMLLARIAKRLIPSGAARFILGKKYRK